MKCKHCGGNIKFIKTPAGKSMPCDTVPVRYWLDASGAGRIVTPAGAVLRCGLNGDIQKASGMGYVPHWATCGKP